MKTMMNMKLRLARGAQCAGQPRRTGRPSGRARASQTLPLLAAAGLLLTTGCAHQTARRQKANRFLAEESRVLTTAIVDTLTEQPTERRDAYTATALLLARQDQRLEGLPIAPIHIEPLISSNHVAVEQLAARFEAQNKAVGTREAAGERLIALGEVKEIEINAQRARWFKWGGGLSILLGGIVALCVFCPVALPILGRLLAWVAGKIPSWAGALGVVSVKAFDAVVRGVEKTRKTAANTDESVQTLETNLAMEMDEAHKALVRTRKQAQPI